MSKDIDKLLKWINSQKLGVSIPINLITEKKLIENEIELWLMHNYNLVITLGWVKIIKEEQL